MASVPKHMQFYARSCIGLLETGLLQTTRAKEKTIHIMK